jgi:xylulokinase
LLPYFEGERTPDRPEATGTLIGLSLSNSNPENIARAMIEGMLCGLVDAVSQLEAQGVEVRRILLIGGAAKNPAVAPIASSLFGKAIYLPQDGEYVADGAAKQIAWALQGTNPQWSAATMHFVESKHVPIVMERYLALVNRTKSW